VLVSELLDVLERGFRGPDGGDIRSHVITRHPLQAFSPRYFDGSDSRLFSYRDDLCIAPAAMTAHRRPLVSAPLPEPPDAWREITMHDLLRFFRHPVRFFLEKRLGVALRESVAEVEADEPFALDRYSAADLRQRLTEAMLRGSSADWRAVETARGILPQGEVGERIYRDACRAARQFAQTLRQSAAVQEAMVLPLDLVVGGVHVTGSLDGVMPRGLFEYRAIGEIHARQRIEFWLRHLLLHAAAPERSGASEFHALDSVIRLSAVDNAAQQLADLLTLWREGGCRPLHFFPRAAVAYVDAQVAGKDAPGAARRTWHGSDYNIGEADDDCYRLAFGDTDPLDHEFESLARRLLEPMSEHETTL
jgi:exodeoxyribonuclease V gamma subunit